MIKFNNEGDVSFKDLRNAFGFSRKELADLLSTSSKVIRRLENNKLIHSFDYQHCKQKLDAWAAILSNLDELFDLETIVKWTDAPNNVLKGLTPKEFIKNGEISNLADVLENIGR